MEKVLIIQDSPSTNMLLKVRLEGEGVSVDAVETGQEGIDKAREGDYELILLDYNLPDINGDEVCKVLKSEEKFKNIPIIYMSAKDEDEMYKIAEETGADGFVAVPFDAKELLDTIKGGE